MGVPELTWPPLWVTTRVRPPRGSPGTFPKKFEVTNSAVTEESSGVLFVVIILPMRLHSAPGPRSFGEVHRSRAPPAAQPCVVTSSRELLHPSIDIVAYHLPSWSTHGRVGSYGSARLK